MKKEKNWKICLIIETLLAIGYLGLDYLISTFNREEILKFRFLEILLLISLFLLVFYKKYQENKISRWFLVLTLPMLIQFSWGGWFQLALKYLPNIKILSTIVFYSLYLVILLPIIVLLASKIKRTIPRLFIAFWFVITLFDDLTLWTLKTGNIIFNQINTSGLLSGLAFFILGCLLSYIWGFRLNPNLKLKRTGNFSWTVFSVLIGYAIIDIAWNDFGGAGDGLIGAFFKFSADPMKFTFLAFGQAAEAGILEETLRFLNIIILLYAMKNRPKLQVPLTILISSLLFGSMHITNFGWQALAPTIAQAASAFGAGLFLAILYLYSGKLWLAMLEHFLVDYLIFVQTGGSSQPASWSGDINDWATTIASVIVPLMLYIWVMFGNRRKVLNENAQRLIMPERVFDGYK